MLQINASYHCMQFQGKIINQTWENGRKPSFGPDFGLNLVPKILFQGYYLYWMLEVFVSYHCMQFIGKLMYQTGKNDIKPSFGPDFGPFGTNLGHKNFFHGFSLYYMLDIVASYHCMQFQGKLMNQTWENDKKPSFWPDFGPFGQNLASPLLDVRHCCKLSLYIISRKTNESNLRKWQNT